MRPVRQTKQAARKYPTQTQSHDCHQDRPSTIIDDEIIQVFYIQWSSISFIPMLQNG